MTKIKVKAERQEELSTHIKPYGDTYNDGKIQFSFVLPVSADERGRVAARKLLSKMGMYDIDVCYVNDLKEGFTHFIAYASTKASVDLSKISVRTVTAPTMTLEEIDELIEKKLGRKITVVGACIESDAHTVGIDAIMNMKGYNNRFGLERYKYFNAINMGAQVHSEDLLVKAVDNKADAILVSQVVTQKNIHITNLTKLIELAETESVRDKILFICGGPRINNELAVELGYDAGFSSGTYANDVASFIAHRLIEKE